MFNLFRKKEKSITLIAPMNGTLLSIEDVDDPVFSTKMLGDGFAVEPTDGNVVAPCDGVVTQIFPTHHALGLKTDDGLELLIHVGIDTVELKGEGFQRCVEPGTRVTAGTLLLQADLEAIRASGRKITTPVVITNMEKVAGIRLHADTSLTAGKTEAATIILTS